MANPRPDGGFEGRAFCRWGPERGEDDTDHPRWKESVGFEQFPGEARKFFKHQLGERLCLFNY